MSILFRFIFLWSVIFGKTSIGVSTATETHNHLEINSNESFEQPATTTIITPAELTAEESDDENSETHEIAQEQGRKIISSYHVFGEHKHNNEQHTAIVKRVKPLKNIFMGIYKNYKSTYLGNQTALEYKNLKNLRELSKNLKDSTNTPNTPNASNAPNAPNAPNPVVTDAVKEVEEIENTTLATQLNTNAQEADAENNVLTVTENQKLKRKRRKRNKNKNLLKNNKQKMSKLNTNSVDDNTNKNNEQQDDQQYNFGPGVNLTLDTTNDIVNVSLKSENIKEILQGRWLSDNSEEGRGKKYEMITKVLPLFILPFLIQSAIVPFLVTKLKLLLMKSILVGKLAIFLLIISAIKNSNKMLQTYEVGPYWAGEPSRRSELAAAASSAYSGYRVEGKPTTWVN